VPADDPGLRLSDADRDALAAALGRHYTEGRLDADELSRRLDLVYGAQGHDEAAGALAGLPPLPAAAPAERRRWWGRRHGESDAAQPGWLPTTERFVDPTTSRVMRVWVDRADGARHYVAEPAS
jgi:Domain of unknown function (DUF1707)